jgi:Apea-like HEPN
VTLALMLVDARPPALRGRHSNSRDYTVLWYGLGCWPIQPAPVPGPTGTLTANQVDQLRSLSNFVEDRYGPALSIPTRRLISAVAGRHDVEDGLVDAVIAWESLFAGTDVGELSFRIAAAMSWLMGRTADDRLALHREITSLYGTRSRVVHRGVAGRDLTTERDRAVELGTAAMLALQRDHPDLVDDDNRGRKLIMRGESPSS